MDSDTGHSHSRSQPAKGEGYTILQRPRATCGRRGRLLIGALRGSLPPIGKMPSVDEGARPSVEGGASDPSITESAGGSTYHTAVPWLGGARTGRPWHREAGPGRREPIHWTVREAGAAPPRATQTHELSRSLRPRCSSAFRCEARGTSSPPGRPHLRGPDAARPPFAGGERGDGCREARAAPSPSSLHAPPVFPLSRLITAGWLGEEGRWPRRSLGGRLPLTREPPWELEDGGCSSDRPGGGGAEAGGAERGGRERQRPVVAHQNRNQRPPHRHLSHLLRLIQRAAPAAAEPGPPPSHLTSSAQSGRRPRRHPEEKSAPRANRPSGRRAAALDVRGPQWAGRCASALPSRSSARSRPPGARGPARGPGPGQGGHGGQAERPGRR